MKEYRRQNKNLPPRAKISLRQGMQQHVLITILVVEVRLKVVGKDIHRTIAQMIELKRKFADPQIQISFMMTQSQLGLFDSQRQNQVRGSYVIDWAPDHYNPGNHPLYSRVTDELGKLRTSSRVVNNNKGRDVRIVSLSFDISPDRSEEMFDTNYFPYNFQKVHLPAR